MRDLVLATAALVGLGLTAPFAEAQYADPVPSAPAYETPAPSTTTQAPPTQPHQHSTPAPMSPATTSDQSMTPPAHTQTYGHTSAATYPIDLDETARLAGMDAAPMTPADVCSPREVSLAHGTSRLDTRARRQLIVATDHASVCEIQRVVVRSPNGRADAVRQTLIDHGVDESVIEVQTADDGALGVEMRFAGVAASTPEYAAMFNALASQYASLDSQTSAQAGAAMNQPGAYQPTTQAPGAQSVAFEPVEPAAPGEPQTWRPVGADGSTATAPSPQPSTTASSSPYEPAQEVPGGTY